MNRYLRFVAAIACALVLAPQQAPFAQTKKPAPLPRLPDGHPDLQGIWDFRSATALERPARFAGREFMTADEAKYLEAAVVVLGGGERQRRNARYLYAHRHEPSDIYVTDDLTLFGGKDDERRRRLATLFETQIMTLEELKQFCDERRKT